MFLVLARHSWRFFLDTCLLTVGKIIRKLILVGPPSIPFFAWCSWFWIVTFDRIYIYQKIWSTLFKYKQAQSFSCRECFSSFFVIDIILIQHFWDIVSRSLLDVKKTYFINYNKVHIIPEIVIWSLLHEFLDCQNNSFRCWDTKHIFYYELVMTVLEVSLLLGIFRRTNAAHIII